MAGIGIRRRRTFAGARPLALAAVAMSAALGCALPSTAAGRTAGGGHAGRAARSLQASNLRIVLARTYLQTGGPKNIPLPSVTQVIGGKQVQLPPCPAARNRDLNPNVRTVSRLFAHSKSLTSVVEHMRRAAQVPRLGAFPYCAWWLPVDVNTLNIAFPDADAVYWALPLNVPSQQEVIIRGTYPDARYISFAVYNQHLDPYQYTPPGSRRPINSYLADYKILPDAGSANPWHTPGAQPGGSYTIRIKQRIRAGERNALPLLQNPSASATSAHSFPMPPPCGRSGAPACTLPGLFTSPPSADQSSVFSNPDNTYLPALIRPDARNAVWVTRGKLPRTPRGTSPVPWPNRSYQLRYWSMCSAIYVRPYPSITSSGCIVDNDLITDSEGLYTIVVSTGHARPSNATEQNGVNWLRIRPGVANLIILRNMLGSGFRFSTQNVPKNGSWQAAFLSMRDYYPTISVKCTTAHYQADGWQGCVAPKGIGVVGTLR
jgi:hypothetical protein